MTNLRTTTRKATYSNENVLENFYNDLRIASESSNPDVVLKRIHLPHSSVFYTREALRSKFNQDFTLQYVEWCLLVEGMLSVDDCFEGSLRVTWNEYKGDKLCKTL